MSTTPVNIELIIRAESQRLRADLAKMQKTINRRFGMMRRSVRRLMGPLAGLFGTAIAVRGVARATAGWGDFEKALSNVQAKTTSATAQMAGLRAEVIKVASATQFTGTQAAQGAGFLAMAGLDIDTIKNALKPTLALAAATDASAQIAADVMTNIATPLGLLTEAGMQRVADVVAKTTASANVSITELGESFAYAASSFEPLGVSLEEGASLIGAMGDAGIKGSRAGTAFRQILVAITRAESQLGDASMETIEAHGKQIKALKKLGVSLKDNAGKSKPFMQIFNELVDAGANAKDLIEIFGSRAGATLGAVLNRKQRIADLNQILIDSEGTIAQMQETQLDNLAGDVLIFHSNMEALRNLFFGAGFGDMIRGWIRSATIWVSSMQETVKKISRAIVLLVRLIGKQIDRAKEAMGRLHEALKRVLGEKYEDTMKTLLGILISGAIAIAVVKTIKTVISLTKAAWALGVAFKFAALVPFLIIAAVTAAFYFLLKFSKQIKAFFIAIGTYATLWWEDQKATALYFVALWLAVYKTIWNYAKYSYDLILHYILVFVDKVVEAFNKAKNILIKVLNWVIDQVNYLLQKIMGVTEFFGFDAIEVLMISKIEEGPDSGREKRVAPEAPEDEFAKVSDEEYKSSKSALDNYTLGGGIDQALESMKGNKSLLDQLIDGAKTGIGELNTLLGQPLGVPGAGTGEDAESDKGEDTEVADTSTLTGNIMNAQNLFGSLMEASNIATEGMIGNFDKTFTEFQEMITNVFTKGGKEALDSAKKLATKFLQMSKKGAKIAKAMLIGQAIRQTYASVTTALQSVKPTWPKGAAAAAWALAKGIYMVKKIKSSAVGGQAHSGITEVPKDGTWNLQKGERVLDRNINADLKDFIGKAGGVFNEGARGAGNVIYLQPRGMYSGEDIQDAFGEEEGTVILQSEVR